MFPSSRRWRVIIPRTFVPGRGAPADEHPGVRSHRTTAGSPYADLSQLVYVFVLHWGFAHQFSSSVGACFRPARCAPNTSQGGGRAKATPNNAPMARDCATRRPPGNGIALIHVTRRFWRQTRHLPVARSKRSIGHRVTRNSHRISPEKHWHFARTLYGFAPSAPNSSRYNCAHSMQLCVRLISLFAPAARHARRPSGRQQGYGGPFEAAIIQRRRKCHGKANTRLP